MEHLEKLGTNMGMHPTALHSFAAAAIFITVLSSVAVQKGESLHCWECNSKYDPNCGEPFKNYTLSFTDCSQRFLPQDPNMTSSICRKIVQIVSGEQRVIRGCGYIRPDDESGPDCYMRAGTHQVLMYYCHCDNKDGCNGAAMPRPLAFTVAIVIAICLAKPSFFALIPVPEYS